MAWSAAMGVDSGCAPSDGTPTAGLGVGPVRIVWAGTLRHPDRLAGLAQRIFGEGDRPAGWFATKRRRERIDLSLSPVAIREGMDPDDPQGWLGYVLVGTPGSLAPAVRTAGTGVLPAAQGHGIGRRLLEAVAQRCRAAGHRRVQLLAEPALVPFYRRHGFARVHDTLTVVAFGRGPTDGPPPWGSPTPWGPVPPGQHQPVAWLPEAWAGTTASARHTVHWRVRGDVAANDQGHDTITAWISREGVAWLVQRLLIPRGRPLPACAAALLDRLPTAAPVLLPMLRADAPATAALLDAGWAAAQPGALLERTL